MPSAFKIKGLKKLEKMLDAKKITPIVKKHLRAATRLNGEIVEGQIRDEIHDGKFKANAKLTEAIKGENKPLVGIDDGAQLFGSISSKEVNETTVFVGVLKTERFYNIALRIHDGVAIGVTPKMRRMFFALWAVSNGKMEVGELSGRAAELYGEMPDGWKPLKKSTSVINIPARPFVSQAFANKEIRQLTQANWTQAVEAAIKEIGKGA